MRYFVPVTAEGDCLQFQTQWGATQACEGRGNNWFVCTQAETIGQTVLEEDPSKCFEGKNDEAWTSTECVYEDR